MRLRAVVSFGTLIVVGLTSCGGNGGATFSQNPPPPQSAEYLYGSHLADIVVTEKIDSTTGALGTGTSTPGTNGVGITANPAATFIYGTDGSTTAIDGFSIGSSGAISVLAGSPFLVHGSGGVNGIAIDSSGKFLYATSNNGTGIISGYSIDSSGALTAVPNSPFAAGATPLQIAVDPVGAFLYVSDAGGGMLAYSITSSSGTLTPISLGSVNGGSQGIAIRPDGKFLYAIDISSLVYAYSIAADGTLTAVSGSPFTVDVGSGTATRQVIVDPKGKFLYTYNTVGAPSTISAFAIDSTSGSITPVSGSPFNTSEVAYFAASLAIEPSGKFLYASCASGNCGILGFNIDATTGALSPILGSPFDSFVTIGTMAIVSIQ